MALFGLFGGDRESHGSASRESATERNQRKHGERESRAKLRRHRSATAADRAGWAWADAERRRQG